MKKNSSFLVQVLIFSAIMLVSEAMSYLLKSFLPAPSSVVGMVILFLLLCFKVVKLENVEELGSKLIALIGFLFVPSGISVVQYWDIMAQSGLQISLIIFITTIILLAGTGWFAQLVLGKKSIDEIARLEKASREQEK